VHFSTIVDWLGINCIGFFFRILCGGGKGWRVFPVFYVFLYICLLIFQNLQYTVDRYLHIYIYFLAASDILYISKKKEAIYLSYHE
jgi:hypothetical protein